MESPRKPPTLDYATPRRRFPRLPVHPVAGLSLILGIVLCAAMGQWHTNPREYPLGYHDRHYFRHLLWNLFVYCGPFVLLAAGAAWTIRRRAQAESDTRLAAVAALIFNGFVILWFGAEAIYFYRQLP